MFFGGSGGMFSQFGNMGGDGNELPDTDDEYEENQDNEKYYEILQVDRQAAEQQIELAYKKLIKEHDADQQGSAQKLKQIETAYSVLSDPEKRQIYDAYGPSALAQMGQKQQPKMQATKKALQLTLQQIYSGVTIEVPHVRARCCEQCGGKGGKNVTKCKTCKGQGAVLKVFQVGPGMYGQAEQKCEQCSGSGDIIGEGGKCQTCSGQKIVKKEANVKVTVERGVPDGTPIILAGQGNQIPDTKAGDLVFVVQQKEHQHFTRKGGDLYFKKHVTLFEALVGFSFSFRHLDGIQYYISSQKDDVISDGHKKVVRGLGMPFFKKPESYGNLIVEFHVDMPKRGDIPKESIKEFAGLLPGKVNERPKDDKYEMLEDFELVNLNTNEEGGGKDVQEDQDIENQGISCQGQ